MSSTDFRARMTPTQANMARFETRRYVLCVVDLCAIPEDRLDGLWTAADIEPLAVLVTDIGNNIAETCEYIDKARRSDIAIRNEQALRYEVPQEIWLRGISISNWIDVIARRS
jgi:hypothetical protein